MRKYEKIETIFARDIEGTKKLIPNMFRDSTVEYLARNDWIWTEKVDGTNIRVFWDGHQISFAGRTDSAVIPTPLYDRLSEIFLNDVAEELFEQTFGEKEVIIFGEGYGNKIQKVGNKYIKDSVDFIIFDVLIGDNYQERKFVKQTAQIFGLKAVPVIGIGNLYEAVEFMKMHPMSVISEEEIEMEGLVCRPVMELRNRCGERIIVKIKWNDMKELI